MKDQPKVTGGWFSEKHDKKQDRGKNEFRKRKERDRLFAAWAERRKEKAV